ncbi:FUSC family protein [Sphingomonas sp. BK235]|uniref:FUSC family protein n=1 Tax=Sphingomonas sp. BK235 TaxID=2512131 RepID=UPI0010465286|nr:FUSC family protein [Sphingomonas sp. BK235]TCP33707.1 putative membrane protein YccC [Sphingomonas sp. BK235]
MIDVLARRAASLSAILWRRIAAIDPATPQWQFVARSVLAAGLALAAGFALQVEAPFSAASTVLLVTNPNQGAVLAKGGWRLIGTLIGGVGATLLMAFFIQTPALFLLGFGLWLGVCGGAATVLRHFRASGAAVAGYTVGLATYGALERPERALDAVLGRTATVALGVVCLGGVTALLSRRATRTRLEAAYAAQLAKVGRLLSDVLAGDRAAARGAPELAAGLFAIDDLLELSRTESPDVAVRAGAVREGLAALFGATLGAAEWTARRLDDPALAPARAEIARRLPVAIGAIERDALAEARVELTALRHRLHAEAEADHPPAALIALDRLLETIEDVESALLGLMRLRARAVHRGRGFRYHRDWGGAWRNGLRALLAILAGGAIGIATGWSEWSLLPLILAPYVVLLALVGNPEAGAIAFVKGTVVAVPAAWLCGFVLLPRVTELPLLLAAIAPFWIAGLYLLTIAKRAPAALAYLVAFNTLVGATNPMAWDAAAFLNAAFGWVVAVLVTWLVFRLLPHQPHRQARRIAAALRRDVVAAMQGRARGGRSRWEHLQHHRLVRIAQSLVGDPPMRTRLLAEGLDEVHLGCAALRLHAALDAAPIDDPAGAALALAVTSPGTAAPALRAAARTTDLPHRIAAGLTDIADLLDRRSARAASC